MTRSKITHAELVAYGRRWLYRHNCGYVAVEECGMSLEFPDLLGFRSNFTIMIEAKRSRRDYRKDMSKFFRAEPEHGVGNYRYYLCPDGLIKPEEIPSNWGLIYLKGKRLYVIKGPQDFNEPCLGFWQKSNIVAENEIMYSVLRKSHRRGLI